MCVSICSVSIEQIDCQGEQPINEVLREVKEVGIRGEEAEGGELMSNEWVWTIISDYVIRGLQILLLESENVNKPSSNRTLSTQLQCHLEYRQVS